MSNITINNLPTALTIDATQDILPIYTASGAATQGISRNTLLGLASAPVGLTDSQTLSSKILTSPTINGATLSGTLSGTYTIGGTPTFPASVATLTGSQTLTNKVLTSPTINSPTITNATISADTVTGFSTSNTGTIYGISVTTGVFSTSSIVPTASIQDSAVSTAKLAANAVTTAKITNASVTADKLATGAAQSLVSTSGTTTSATYTSTLSGSTAPTVTVTVGANGLLLVLFRSQMQNSGTNNNQVSVALGSANVAAASDTIALLTNGSTLAYGWGSSHLYTGLSAGSTTVTMNFRVTAGTGTFANMEIIAIPL